MAQSVILRGCAMESELCSNSRVPLFGAHYAKEPLKAHLGKRAVEGLAASAAAAADHRGPQEAPEGTL